MGYLSLNSPDADGNPVGDEVAQQVQGEETTEAVPAETEGDEAGEGGRSAADGAQSGSDR